MSEEKEKEGFILESIRRMADEMSPELVKAISSELQPYLDGIRTTGAQSRSFKLFKGSYLYFLKKCEKHERILGTIMRAEGFPIFDVKDEVYALFIYLGLVESLGNSIADIITMLLVANGRQFHIECQHTTPRIKHAISIQDLEKERVSLTTKLNFMKENDIFKLTSIIDSKLRNDIAHMKFDVREGGIYVKGKPVRGAILKSILDLLSGQSITRILLDGLAKERGISQ